MATYKTGSRLRNANYGTFDGETVVFPKTIDYSTLTPVTSYTITNQSSFRPDFISIDVYHRPDLGWHIMAFNQLDHVSQLYAGRVLNVPPIQGLII